MGQKKPKTRVKQPRKTKPKKNTLPKKNNKNNLDVIRKLKRSAKLLQLKNKELLETVYRAQESSRLQNEFLANVTHELRTPLNGILGFAKILHEDLVDPSSPRYKEFLKDIIISADHLLSLINDVLDFSKFEAGKIEFHPIEINLASILKEMQDVFASEISEKNITFKIKLDPNLGHVIIDPVKLKQILYNFISNALKFTPSGGKVTVSMTKEARKNFRITVADTGIGISKENLDKLFIRFQQLDASTNKSYAGTGLGLALIKRIVEAQGGQVGVESSLGKGSIFYAVLPCFPYHKTVIKNNIEKQTKLTSDPIPKILLVERESQDRSLLIDALIEDGYSVITAPSVATAIEENNEQKFQAIILDLLLPYMGDWQLIRMLSQPETTVVPIAITASLEQAISLGPKIESFLVKPVKEEDLLLALKKLEIDPHQNKTILVVDDDLNAFGSAYKILTSFGFRLIHKTNRLNALLALEQETPDVVILDPLMSEMNGFEFLRFYRQIERGLFTPVIIWSKRALTLDEQLNLKASIQRVIIKGESLQKDILHDLDSHF